ncbi:hypothetical protein RAA17_24945 [Komagataeibacter rhaeticus]|nr:hypothetical protein [Komagataeibacter rhaeticus]
MNVITALELADGLRALQQLIAEQTESHDRNEAETRFHLIDCLLQGVLGWDRADFKLETAQGRSFTDYEFGNPVRMIWEAKREGIPFSIPVRTRRGNIYDIASISAASEDARDAIMQANRYCLNRGSEIAVATNGHQFVAFCAREPEITGQILGKCLVISSLADFERNLSRLWDFLSRGDQARRPKSLPSPHGSACCAKEAFSFNPGLSKVSPTDDSPSVTRKHGTLASDQYRTAG